MTDSEKSKLYPVLPTAPHDGSFERYNRVKSIYNELKIMRDKRNTTYKKYRRVSSGLYNTIFITSALGVAETAAAITTSLTGVGLPIGAILGGLAGLSALTTTALTAIAKRCDKKKLKHAKLHAILDTGVTVLDKKISNVLNDNIIDDKEFNEIVDEYEKIKQKLSVLDIEKVKAEVIKDFKSKLQL